MAGETKRESDRDENQMEEEDKKRQGNTGAWNCAEQNRSIRHDHIEIASEL